MGSIVTWQRRESRVLSRAFTLTLLLSVHSIAFSQQDSVVVAREFRFAPAVRGGFLEATSLLLIVGTFGASADFDLVQIPGPTIQHAGIRLTFQQLTSALSLAKTTNHALGYLSGAFLRGTQKIENSCFDIMMGVVSVNPNAFQAELSFMAAVDVHWIIFQPYCTFFMRIMANQRGAVPLFGLSLGYID